MNNQKIKIYFDNGTIRCPFIIVEGTKHCDLLELIEDHIREHGVYWTAIYTYEDLLKDFYHPDEETLEEFDDWISTEYLPINGGEYYVGTIAGVTYYD